MTKVYYHCETLNGAGGWVVNRQYHKVRVVHVHQHQHDSGREGHGSKKQKKFFSLVRIEKERNKKKI